MRERRNSPPLGGGRGSPPPPFMEAGGHGGRGWVEVWGVSERVFVQRERERKLGSEEW